MPHQCPGQIALGTLRVELCAANTKGVSALSLTLTRIKLGQAQSYTLVSDRQKI